MAEVIQDRVGLLQGSTYVQTVEVVQSVACGFEAHLHYTLLLFLRKDFDLNMQHGGAFRQ